MNKPYIVVESTLDGILLHQELSDIFKVYSLGSAQARPNKDMHEYIKNHPGIISLDDDMAGHTEEQWWTNQYKTCIPLYLEFGKDPGEAFEAGENIRAWGIDGLNRLKKAFPGGDDKIVKSDNSKTESFKNEVYQDFDKNKPVSKPISTPILDPVFIPDPALIPSIPISKVCIHNKFCQSLKSNICLIDNINIYDDDKQCPKEQWSKFVHAGGVVTEIILGVGVRK